VAEQIGDEMAPTDAQARAEVISRHASTALWNAQEHDKIFLLPVLKAIGSPWRFFRGRTLAKIAAVVGTIAAIIAIMAFVPWPLTIEGKGSLLPENRRIVYAPIQGVVTEVLVDHEQRVKKGDLLAKLENKELDKEYRKLLAEKADANTKLANISNQLIRNIKPDEKAQLTGEQELARIKLESSDAQIAVLEEQKKMLEVRAPLDGMVTTWETKKNLLNRPVEVGTELIQIAGLDGDWVLEVEVPDNDMAPILAARATMEKAKAKGERDKDAKLPAYFVTATDPEHKFAGYVERIAAKAETVEGKHIVKVTVGFSDDVKKDYLKRNNIRTMRPGAEVRARVQCYDAKLAYVMLRDVIQVWHETVMFRWPFLK
jgi:multidrug efflux pump subunit AcrA (membrane-fusion protein)